MSNASITSRILEVVAAFEASKCSAYAVNQSIELHAPAFEGIPREQVDALNALGLKLLTNDVSDLEREQLGWADTSGETIRDIKGLLIAISRLA
jgi:hypothetical protein